MQVEEIVRRVLAELDAIKSVKKESFVILGPEETLDKKTSEELAKDHELIYQKVLIQLDHINKILLPKISPTTLIKLSLGMNPREGYITEALVLGKEVYYLEEGLFHRTKKDSCPKELYIYYEEAVERLKYFGIKPGFSSAFQAEKSSQEIGGQRKKLLTERDVQLLAKEGHKVLVVEPGTVVTPLAKDVLKEYGISMDIKSGGRGYANS